MNHFISLLFCLVLAAACQAAASPIGGDHRRSLDGSCTEAQENAESSCKASFNCTACSDFNFGDDCKSNNNEHCAEVLCCPRCGPNIYEMFGCEHTSCGALDCNDYAPPTATSGAKGEAAGAKAAMAVAVTVAVAAMM